MKVNCDRQLPSEGIRRPDILTQLNTQGSHYLLGSRVRGVTQQLPRLVRCSDYYLLLVFNVGREEIVVVLSKSKFISEFWCGSSMAQVLKHFSPPSLQ